MPANARNTMRVVDSGYTHETNVVEPVLNDLPSGRIPGSDDVTRAQDARFGRRSAVTLASIFAVLAAVVGVLTLAGVVSGHAASLMLWSLVGLYFAFGILIVMYRLISKLE
jgi:hypothetical protein